MDNRKDSPDSPSEAFKARHQLIALTEKKKSEKKTGENATDESTKKKSAKRVAEVTERGRPKRTKTAVPSAPVASSPVGPIASAAVAPVAPVVSGSAPVTSTSTRTKRRGTGRAATNTAPVTSTTTSTGRTTSRPAAASGRAASAGAASASSAIPQHPHGFVRMGWVWDAQSKLFFPPPCQNGPANWTCGKCGHNRKRGPECFFDNGSGGRVVAGPAYCMKCYKRLLGQKKWTWFPWADFPTPPWMGRKDNDKDDGMAGASGMAAAA